MFAANANGRHHGWSGLERRRFTRVCLQLPLHLRTHDVEWTAESVDLSVGGLLASTPFFLPPTQTITIRFSPPGYDGDVTLEGRVVRFDWPESGQAEGGHMAVALLDRNRDALELVSDALYGGEVRDVFASGTRSALSRALHRPRSFPGRPSAIVWLACLLIACPDGKPPDFEGILALTALHEGSAPVVRVEWKKAYDGTPFHFRLYAAVDRDPDTSGGSLDVVSDFAPEVLSHELDPRTLFGGSPPANFLDRSYRFAVAAIDDEAQTATSAVQSIVPGAANACGCQLTPTVNVPNAGPVPLLPLCTWTRVEGAESCHWTMRTDKLNSDPAEPDPYHAHRAEVFFHPAAAASRPIAIALHGGTAYSAAGLEYASVAMASHAVDGEGGNHARGYLVFAPQMHDAFAGTVGTTAEGEEIERIQSAIAIFDFLKRLTTSGNPAYNAAVAGLLSPDFSRLAATGGSDGGITTAALVASPPGPLPFPHGDLIFPTVPFRNQIRAVFIVAPGATASPHAMNLKDGPTAIGGQIAVPAAVITPKKDITNSSQTAEKTYDYTIVDDPDSSSPGKDKFLFYVRNGLDDVMPSRNAHVCLADPRGFDEAYLCDDVFGTPVLGLPIQPSMLDHHRLLRHRVRLFLDRYVRNDTSITRETLTAPWYSPAHPTPDPDADESGYDASGYPVPAVVEETGPAV